MTHLILLTFDRSAVFILKKKSDSVKLAMQITSVLFRVKFLLYIFDIKIIILAQM